MSIGVSVGNGGLVYIPCLKMQPILIGPIDGKKNEVIFKDIKTSCQGMIPCGFA